MSRLAARRWAIFFLLFILFGTLMPSRLRDAILDLVPYPAIVQKSGHVAAFAGAAFLTLRGAFWRVRPWHVFVLGLLVAVGTEAMQVLIRGRSPSTRDLLFDMAGVCVGIFLGRLTAKAESDTPA